MRKVFATAVMTLFTSAYLFPISFTFLPNAVNSKIMVAVFGILAFAFNGIRNRGLKISEPTLFAGLLAAVFSAWCLFSVTEGNTYDMTYASYFVSFLTWMFGAYGVCAALSLVFNKEADMDLIVRFLALACVFQCIMAVVIDNNAAVSGWVDRFLDDKLDFYKRGHRLYGIGAALDPAGIRFSAVLVVMAHVFATSEEVHSNNLYQTSLLLGYTIIVIIGAVISRTTLVGASLGLAYMVIYLFRLRKGGFATIGMIQFFFWFFALLAVIIVALIYFYRSSVTFQGYVRFGFEAFFNWVETGEFRTSSTDTLNTMWIWPADWKTWLIGRGTFGIYDNGTDIGYCNFVFYCGLVGMVIFSIYFLYCHLVLNRKFNNFLVPSLFLIVLTFTVWVKVTTDIFFLDAILLCAASEKVTERNDPVVVVPREPV